MYLPELTYNIFQVEGTDNLMEVRLGIFLIFNRSDYYKMEDIADLTGLLDSFLFCASLSRLLLTTNLKKTAIWSQK